MHGKLKVLYGVLLAVMLAALGCGESAPAEVLEPEGANVEEVKEKEDNPIPPYLDRFAQRAGSLLRGRATNPAILASVKKQAKRKVAERKDPYHYRSILRRVYMPEGGSGAELYFVSGARLTPLGHEVLDHLKAMESHGLNIHKHYHVKAIEKLLKELPSDTPPELTLSETDRAAITTLIKDNKLDVGKANTDRALVNLLTAAGSPLPDFASRVPEDEALSDKAIKRVAKIEMYLTDAVSRYAWDMRFRNRRWFDEKLFEGKRKFEWEQVLADLLRDTIPEALSSKGDLVAWMKELIPNNRQYHKLIPVLARYRGFKEAGGWDEVKQVKGLRKGMRHDVVPELKKRLRAEGFFPEDGSMSKRFDDALEAAIRAYQETHQMDVTGEPHKSFWGSINVSLSKRLKQITVTLDRWRYQTNIIEGTEDEYFVFVNIPDFNAEIWRKGKREMRFKVIVGNRKFGCNANTGRWVRINTTPRQSNLIR
ncbi:MAG: peptidoglycan-binding protein, partial [Myxococcota bacterium]